ncbi:MAG: hypothetical protein KAG97_08595 [Victivallales bacterium]|nr:hypothetical protein [Victivallales bacterium]
MLYNYPMFDEMRENLYAKPDPFYDLSKPPSDGEVKIDGSWRIVGDAEEPTIGIAANDLIDFLKCHAEIELSVVEESGGANDIILTIRDAAHKEDAASESFHIDISSERIIVSGADAVGVMYGVFRIQEMMRRKHSPILTKGRFACSPMLKNRISRSPAAFFQGVEFEYLDTAYTDNYLRKMAHYHINGIWVHAHMRDLVATEVFPTLSGNAERYSDTVGRLIDRAAKFGIKVFIYCQEPMGIHKTDPFWNDNLDVRGHYSDSQNSYALCTSTQKVRDFLFEGSKRLFIELPGLGGLIVISSSEFNSHCFIGMETNCERCRSRTKSDVTSEVLNLLNAGAKAARKNAEIIAWNWSWGPHQSEIIKRLDDSISLMADYERGANRTFVGIKHTLDEYSLSYVGPSERFMEVAGHAGNERRMYAKLQLGVTHEIATVPYFPVMQKIAQKFLNMKKLGLAGVVECWNFGNILSRNIEVSNLFAWENDYEKPEDVLVPIAERDFGVEAAPGFLAAWRKFCEATDHYPFQNPFIYRGSLNYGGAYPLIFEKLDKIPPTSWHLFGEVEYEPDFSSYSNEWGDDIDVLCSNFGRDCTIDSFRIMTDEWGRGVEIMRSAVEKTPEPLMANAESELNVCMAIHSQFLTTYNFLHFIDLRDSYLNTETQPHKLALLYRLRKIALDEIANSETLKICAAKDNRLGFHGEAFGFFYNAAKIDEKIRITKQSVEHIDREISLLAD